MVIQDHKAVNVDWAWVRRQVLAKERMPAGKKGAPDSLAKAFDECLRVAKHLASAAVIYDRKNVLDVSGRSIKLEGQLSLSTSSLSAHLHGAKYAYLFLVTIGSDLEETASMLMEKGEQLHGYLLDRIGSFAVESLAEGVEKELRRAYRARNMSVSMRFSPGYCDWPIEEQFRMNKAMGFSRAGVRLTDSCMMVPRKSISGLIGIGPKGLFSGSKSRCDICNIKSCDYKRV